ncbi:uncharacterized protein LOC143854446 [Tasmannia lanceolata]|uniref:uncharacterized protein LOC143854446 n=1 Tax=Tasmannia lanceolata TaxID=3420 RepID=UPI004063AC69
MKRAREIDILQAQEEVVIQDQASHSHASMESDQEEETSLKSKKKRGPTKLDHLYKMEGRLMVKLNKYKQVVGNNASKCGKFLGVTAKIGSLLPIDVFSWKNMPESNKEDAWSTLLEKFDVPIDGKDWVMGQLNEKWRYHKYKLRRKYFNERSDEVIFPPKFDGIIKAQYIRLWNHWKTHEFQKQSTTNAANRNKSWTPHTGGSKAFAVIIEEEEEKTKKPYGRDELWIKTRTRKDGSFVNDSYEDTVKKIREIQKTQPMENSQSSVACKDDILSQAIGQDKHGRLRCLGKGPTPSTVDGKKSGRETSNAINEALKMKLASMEEEMIRMKELLLQNEIIEGDHNSPNQVHSSAASHIDQPAAIGSPPITPNSIPPFTHVIPNDTPLIGTLDAHTSPPFSPPTNPLVFSTTHIAPTNPPIVTNPPLPIAPHTSPVVARTSHASPRTKARNNKVHECIPCKLMNSEGNAVAKGFLKSEDPNQIVGGKKLGVGWCEVTINGGISRQAKLLRPTGKLQVIGDALGSNVAWPRAFVKLMNRK